MKLDIKKIESKRFYREFAKEQSHRMSDEEIKREYKDKPTFLYYNIKFINDEMITIPFKYKKINDNTFEVPIRCKLCGYNTIVYGHNARTQKGADAENHALTKKCPLCGAWVRPIADPENAHHIKC